MSGRQSSQSFKLVLKSASAVPSVAAATYVNYVGNESNFDIIPASSNVFTGDTKLVGGKGTTYNSAHTSYIYARIDDPDNSKPGYFTDIADKPIEP